MTSAVIVEPLKPGIHGLLCCSIAAGPLFVTVFVLEGARRPDYKPLRHPVSSLLGTRLGPALFAGVGFGLLGSAAFCTDPVSGYPPGTPDVASDPTATGAMHNIAALPIFLGIPAAALTCARRFHQAGRQGWGRYSAATGVSTLIGMALFGAGFSQASPRLTDCAGLLQRATIATGFGWLTALSAQALRRALPVESSTPIGLGERAFPPPGSGPFKGLSSAGHNPRVTVSNLVTPKITRKAGTCPPLEYSIRS